MISSAVTLFDKRWSMNNLDSSMENCFKLLKNIFLSPSPELSIFFDWSSNRSIAYKLELPLKEAITTNDLP